MTELFTQLTVEQHGRVRLVEPKVVLEIACDTIQRSARHASGYALRFPRIKRVRWDKSPADADRLQRIAEIYRSTANFAQGGTDGEGSGGKAAEDFGDETPSAEPAALSPLRERVAKPRKKAAKADEGPTLFDTFS